MRAVMGRLVSRPEVYARLHDKLVRSYVLDALLDKPGKTTGSGEAQAVARDFVASTEATREEVFPSVGYGRDYRFTTPTLAGSALVHDGKLIHLVAFRRSQQNDSTTFERGNGRDDIRTRLGAQRYARMRQRSSQVSRDDNDNGNSDNENDR